MKTLLTLLTILLFSFYYSQNKFEKVGKITENITELYVKDTLKKQFKIGDYIAISIFSDSISNKTQLYIETIEKDFNLYKNTSNYKWFTYKGKKIIVFCGLDSTEKCKKYFEILKFRSLEENNIKLLDKNPAISDLDGDIKLWSFILNKDYKIIEINGKMINAEIANPKGFKKFLKKHSVLKLYQLYKNGNIIIPKNIHGQ